MEQSPTDEELIARVAKGDGYAFDTLVRRHLHRAYGIARRVLASREDAEEAAQDAFTKVWTRACDWQPGRARFTTWFYRIVVNSALDLARKRTKGTVENPDDSLASLADAGPSSESNLMAHQEEAAVHAAVSELTAQQRTAITLCYFEGHTNVEAAEIMGLNLKALEGLLVRARRGLKEQLSKRLKDDRYAA